MDRTGLAKRPKISMQDIPAALSAGFVIGILVIFIEVSFAAMIFSGDLRPFLGQGIGIALFGALVIGIVSTLTSSFSSTISLPQDSPAAILGVAATAIAVSMSAASSERVFATVVAAMMLSTIVTGIFFWLMGRFNLGALVRFIPYPVVGGFLAGVGWLVVVGGIGVMTDAPFGPALFQAEALVRWLPGFLFALAFLFIILRYSHFLIMPAFLLAGIGLFYLVYYINNGTVSTAGAEGWLLGPFPEGRMWNPGTTLTAVTQADWGVVVANAIKLSTIVLVSAISLLLNASGLEIIAAKDFDLNQELRSAGIANILAGIGGSPAGYHALSLSALGFRLGAQSRLVGIFSALLVGFSLLFGAAVLSIFPRMIAGGFLLFLGFTFLVAWLYESWFKLPKLDYLLIWVILIVIATVGLLEGVAVGIVISVVLFVVNYSRTRVIRHAATGANYQSHVMRPRLYEQLLHRRGDSFAMIELQGFIFFGTAHTLVEQIKERIENPARLPLKFLLLDFRLVTGVDSSATLSFSRLMQMIESREIQLVLTHLSSEIQRQLQKEVLMASDADEARWRIFPTMMEGMAWCEEQMITVFTEIGLVAETKTLLQSLDERLPATEEKTDWLDSLNPLTPRQDSPHESRLMPFVERIDAHAGEVIIQEGQDVHGLYFVESGQVIAQHESSDDSPQQFTVMETGTVFGEIGVYTGRQATATVVVSKTATLYYLSTENLKRIEREDAELAIAIHRLIADNLGRKLTQATNSLHALQR